MIRDVIDCVIKPALNHLELYSDEAVDLLVGTALAESGLRALRQFVGGPALGFWQMEPATYMDIWGNYIKYRPELRDKVLYAGGISRRKVAPTAEVLSWNLRYACAMARVHYLRAPGAIPLTVPGQAEYWKQYYNTPLGKGTIEHYMRAWDKAYA